MPALREIVAIAVVSPIYKNSTWLKQSVRFVHSFGYGGSSSRSLATRGTSSWTC